MNARAPRPLSRDDLLTDEQLARELGVGTDKARAWADTRGIRRHDPVIGWRTVWGDVVDAFRATTGAPAPGAGKRLPRRTG